MNKMKNIIIFLFITFLSIGLGSCEQKFKIDPPQLISFTYEPDPAVMGTVTIFSVEANADMAVIWSGLDNSNYDEYITNPTTTNKGVAVSLEYDKLDEVYKGSKFFIYPKDSTYKVVLILTNVGEMGNAIEQTVHELTLDVTAPPPVK